MEYKEGIFANYRLLIIIGILAVASIAVALYFTFLSPIKCDSYTCFQTNMAQCNKATYINEDPEASWRYTIIGEQGNDCVIDVVLLQAKRGDLELDNLRGESMTCRYPVGIVTYPDSDIGVCTGKLKEELQGIIIKKLYSYILDNLGSLNDTLRSAI